ncbi:MAG: prepilin-type N-terminal cleavage/methylation domain-containing protein [Gammaproteobacteria bacterium]|nr:prepilin-type N-terminal cleavage/methylation domain-containing protein [Gammaproteobacteria bacterium]
MKNRGFTLLEVMTALLITMVLASLAVATYRMPVTKTHQAAAKLDLINLASVIEEYYEQHHTYKDITLARLNFHSNVGEYQVKVISASDSHFKIAAVPIIAHSHDDCGIFYLDQTGDQTVSGSGKQCW